MKITSYEFQGMNPSKFMECNSLSPFVVEGQTRRVGGSKSACSFTSASAAAGDVVSPAQSFIDFSDWDWNFFDYLYVCFIVYASPPTECVTVFTSCTCIMMYCHCYRHVFFTSNWRCCNCFSSLCVMHNAACVCIYSLILLNCTSMAVTLWNTSFSLW